jgi:hypothetical protein
MSGSVPRPARPRRAARLVVAAAAVVPLLGGCGGAAPAAPAAPPASSAPTTAATTTTTAATSAPPAPGQGAGAAFTDPRGRFDLAPPAGWQVDTSGAQGTAAVFLAPDPVDTAKGAFQPNVNVIVAASQGARLAELLDSTRNQLATLNAYRSTTDEDLTLADGAAAHLFGGTFTDQASGLELRNLQLFTVDESSVYVVTGTAPTSAWSTYERLLDGSLRSLTLGA